jgi:hypothetical protein
MSEVMLICASVMTDAKPNTIVKNNRTMFFTDKLVDQTL